MEFSQIQPQICYYSMNSNQEETTILIVLVEGRFVVWVKRRKANCKAWVNVGNLKNEWWQCTCNDNGTSWPKFCHYFKCLQTSEDNKKAYANLCVDFDNGALCVRHLRPGRVLDPCFMPRHSRISRCVPGASNQRTTACTLFHLSEICFWTSQCWRRN